MEKEDLILSEILSTLKSINKSLELIISNKLDVSLNDKVTDTDYIDRAIDNFQKICNEYKQLSLDKNIIDLKNRLKMYMENPILNHFFKRLCYEIYVDFNNDDESIPCVAICGVEDFCVIHENECSTILIDFLLNDKFGFKLTKRIAIERNNFQKMYLTVRDVSRSLYYIKMKLIYVLR